MVVRLLKNLVSKTKILFDLFLVFTVKPISKRLSLVGQPELNILVSLEPETKIGLSLG